jgi:glycyl-tRNA synthetase
VTIDFDSLEDGSVTVRDRDSTEQVRLPVDEVPGEIRRLLDAAGTPAAG